MRKKVLLALAGAMVAAGLAGAGAAEPSLPSISPPTALEKLIATGVLPTDVRGQPGVWNFAGPAEACPGPGWVCTVPGVLPLVQNGLVNIAQVDAEEACPETEQNGTYNKLECVSEVNEGPFAYQTCNADQDGTDAHNELICKLIYDVTTTEPTQCVLQEVDFDQDGVTNKFKAHLRIVQQMHGGGTQEQDARQRIDGDQDAEEKNESEIEEVQNQKMTGSATTQRQNAGCTAPEGPVAGDCNGGDGPDTPYTCVDVNQDAGEGGDNISKLKQELKQEATTNATFASQEQGQENGGNDASVHQDVGIEDEGFALLSSGSSGEGKNFGVSDQYTYQTLPTRPDLEQEQYEDPFCCFLSQEGGGPDSEEVINQVVEQIANEQAEQLARAIGESETPGKCTIHHDVSNGGGSIDREATSGGSGCPFLRMETTCTNNFVPEDEYYESPSTGCVAPPPTEGGG